MTLGICSFFLMRVFLTEQFPEYGGSMFADVSALKWLLLCRLAWSLLFPHEDVVYSADDVCREKLKLNFRRYLL